MAKTQETITWAGEFDKSTHDAIRRIQAEEFLRTGKKKPLQYYYNLLLQEALSVRNAITDIK